MSESDMALSNHAEEDATIELLRLVDPRAAASAARAARVRSAVWTEWQKGTRRRASRKRAAIAGVFAGVAALLVVVGRVALIDRSAVPFGDRVAVVDQVEGDPDWPADVREGRNDVRIQRDDPVRIGEWIETGDRSRVALRFVDGTSVRLDTGSRVRPLASSAIELIEGAVYVDSERETSHFEVRTPVAVARDIGTQFEVRLIDDELRLRVRSGLVELKNPTRSITGGACTEITLSLTGAVSRPIASYGSEWDWTTRVSPRLEMEGHTLATFLERVAREHGWTVEYRDTAVAQEAARIILYGSVSGLPPDDAVDVAVTTSGLQHRFESGVVTVFRRPPETREAIGR